MQFHRSGFVLGLVTALSTALLLSVSTAVPNAFAAGASGGSGDYGGGSGGSSSRSSRSPQKMAQRHYESGLRAKEKAWKLEEKAAKEDDADDRAKLLGKAQKAYEDAVEDQREAVKADPKNYHAQNELGYALRKTGHYDEAIAAYDAALAQNGGYFPAIEYRAEAYLAVGQLGGVKEAYMKLFRNDRKLADQLMTAIDGYLAKQQAGEGDADFAAWVKERKQLAQVGDDLSQNNTRSW